MAGHRFLLTLLGAAVFAATPLPPQDDAPAPEPSGDRPAPPDHQPPNPPPPGDDTDLRAPEPGRGKGSMWRHGEGDEFLKRKLDQIPPERREEFRRNFERWKNMSPEQRDAIRKQERAHHERMCQEVDDAIKQTGLTLDEERRKQFTRRYVQERRKIEQQIQREMEARRRPLIKEMVERLGKEFAASPSPSPSPAPSATPQPSASPAAD